MGKDVGYGGVVHPMDPRWLSAFLSVHKLDEKAIKCIIAALEKYNLAVSEAGKQFELDLKSCLKPFTVIKKPVKKK